MDDTVQALSTLDSLVDLYEVTGEFDIVILVSASDIEEFRDVLKSKVMKIRGGEEHGKLCSAKSTQMATRHGGAAKIYVAQITSI
ncbi:MAG: Lrp/AsnC ligand binding domain-containing protein [Thaumarchaeota archaeon]|nr:Lrp/AsnC ligand binding domain-containing protein [Nitrososphaerota archaeon]